jgi:hypothetical protein
VLIPPSPALPCSFQSVSVEHDACTITGCRWEVPIQRTESRCHSNNISPGATRTRAMDAVADDDDTGFIRRNPHMCASYHDKHGDQSLANLHYTRGSKLVPKRRLPAVARSRAVSLPVPPRAQSSA